MNVREEILLNLALLFEGMIAGFVLLDALKTHWPLLIARNSELDLIVGGTWVVTFVAYWVFGILFFAAYTWREYRIQPVVWNTQRTQKLGDALCTVLFNQFIVNPLFAIMMYPVQRWWGLPITAAELPSLPRMFGEFAVFTLINEVLFYLVHYGLHRYGWDIHKKHHEWSAPVGFIAIYVHPIEHIAANLIPITLGPFLLRSHLFTWWVWLTFAIFVTIETHSGVHLPMMISPEFHDYHHAHVTQNYGVLGLLDRLFGTDKKFRASSDYKYHKIYFGPHYPRIQRR